MSAEHLGILFFGVGWLMGVVGVPAVAGALAASGALMWVVAIVSGTAAGFRRSERGTRFFGASSVSSEINRLTGWYYLPDACSVLGADERVVRRTWMSMTVAAAVSVLVGIAVAVARG